MEETHNEAARGIYRLCMKSYEAAVKAAKRDFFAASIASSSSHLAQLFRVIRALSSLNRKDQKLSDLAISCGAFASFLKDEVLFLCHDLPASIETVRELEVPWPPLGSFFDSFSQLAQAAVDWVLGAVWPTTCLLDQCLSWLLKASGTGIQGPLKDAVNLSLTSGVYLEGLKEAILKEFPT